MATPKRTLKRRIFLAFMALLIAFLSVGVATFAWYIYNTSAYTTNLQMAAGTYSSLLISDKFEGPYSTSASNFLIGDLVPVSTNNIFNGFQECAATRPGTEGQAPIVAYLFKPAAKVDYHIHPLYLRSGSEDLNVYVNIGYDDSKVRNPISTAIRVGLVTYKAGDPETKDQQYIFEINTDQHIETPIYNTDQGQAGHVLDSTKTDGSTVAFTPYTPKNYYQLNNETGEVTITSDSKIICVCPGSESGEGAPVRIDVYVWLEGCDPDCFGTVGILSNLAIQFAGEAVKK